MMKTQNSQLLFSPVSLFPNCSNAKSYLAYKSFHSSPFHRSIFEFAHKKYRRTPISFNISDLYTLESFINLLESKVFLGDTYLIMIKVRYDGNFYYMAGRQFAFNFVDNESLERLYETVVLRIKRLLDEYQDLSDDNVNSLQLIITKVDKSLIRDFVIDKSVNFKDTPISVFNNIKLFLVTTDTKVLGHKINNVIIGDNGLVTSIPVDLESNSFDLYYKILEQANLTGNEPPIFDASCRFYVRNFERPFHILCIRPLGDQSFSKKAFSFKGVGIAKVTDP